jgi:hypothetical protein
MTPRLFKTFLSLDAEMIRIALAEYFLDKYWPNVSEGRIQAISDIAKVFGFINFENFQGFDWQYDLHLYKRYPMCKPMMNNSTLRELIIADGFLEKYVSGDMDAIWPLMGTIFRPESPDQTYRLSQSDDREALLSQDHAVLLGHRFKSHSMVLYSGDKIYKAAVISLLTVLATKHFFAKNYIPLLNSDEKTEKKGINFGWHELAFDISESGNFGTIDQVYTRNVHQIMLYCIKKKQDHDAIKAKTQKTS